jgi:hypothetical protein
MLKRAYQYKDQLARHISSILDDEYYDNLWIDNHVDFIMDVRDNNYSKQQFVSVEPSECWNLIGYFEASINREINSVGSLVVINFKKDGSITFSKDLKDFFMRLFFRYNYSKINFSVVVGSRNEKIYDKFVSKYGGRIVGIFKNHNILQNGKIVDMKFYEIMKEDFQSKVEDIHPKQIIKKENI